MQPADHGRSAKLRGPSTSSAVSGKKTAFSAPRYGGAHGERRARASARRRRCLHRRVGNAAEQGHPKMRSEGRSHAAHGLARCNRSLASLRVLPAGGPVHSLLRHRCGIRSKRGARGDRKDHRGHLHDDGLRHATQRGAHQHAADARPLLCHMRALHDCDHVQSDAARLRQRQGRVVHLLRLLLLPGAHQPLAPFLHVADTLLCRLSARRRAVRSGHRPPPRARRARHVRLRLPLHDASSLSPHGVLRRRLHPRHALRLPALFLPYRRLHAGCAAPLPARARGVDGLRLPTVCAAALAADLERICQQQQQPAHSPRALPAAAAARTFSSRPASSSSPHIFSSRPGLFTRW